MLFLLAFISPKSELIRKIVLSSFEDTHGERSILEARAGKQGVLSAFGLCSLLPQRKS